MTSIAFQMLILIQIVLNASLRAQAAMINMGLNNNTTWIYYCCHNLMNPPVRKKLKISLP